MLGFLGLSFGNKKAFWGFPEKMEVEKCDSTFIFLRPNIVGEIEIWVNETLIFEGEVNQSFNRYISFNNDILEGNNPALIRFKFWETNYTYEYQPKHPYCFLNVYYNERHNIIKVHKTETPMLNR